MKTTLLVFLIIAGASQAQQSGPQPQPPIPVTPEGIPPPAEITPAHPLKAPNARPQRGGSETTGAAPRGRADTNPTLDNENRDRERLQ
jgi:hypothetical protein